jgi:hypothetical protein
MYCGMQTVRQQSTKEGHCLATSSRIGSHQRFLCGLSQGNNRGSRVLFAVCFVEVFSLWSVHGLYSSDVSWQSSPVTSTESSQLAEE